MNAVIVNESSEVCFKLDGKRKPTVYSGGLFLEYLMKKSGFRLLHCGNFYQSKLFRNKNLFNATNTGKKTP